MRCGDPAVDLDFFPDGAAENIIHRQAQGFASYIPQTLFNAGNGTHQNRAAPVKSAPVQNLEKVFDLRRVPPDNILFQLFNGSGNGVSSALDHRLAPTGNSVIGGGFEKEPAGGDFEQFKFGYLHNTVPYLYDFT